MYFLAHERSLLIRDGYKVAEELKAAFGQKERNTSLEE